MLAPRSLMRARVSQSVCPHISHASPLAVHARASSSRPSVIPPSHPVPELDPSFDALLGDMQMAMRGRAKVSSPSASSYEVRDDEISPVAPRSAEPEEADAEAEADGWEPRAERRSPAAVLGAKRIGMVVLPPKLAEGIQQAITESENPREVRFAYLSLLDPTPPKDKASSRNMPQHALARAAAFLPSQYAVMRNVLGELEARIGGIEGPIFELSGGLGPGIWAASDLLGPESVEGACLVHRTRYGLALAERLTKPLTEDIQFRRDINFVELHDQPGVAMASYALSALPKKSGRLTLLRDMLNLGAEHLVLVDYSSPEGWTAMNEARTFLLEQSTPENPLHIIAPCPHEAACPRTEGREPCAFAQRLQRPPFLRKTKHASRGEETTGYTYLVVSRGNRPRGGRISRKSARLAKAALMGGVARDEEAKAIHLASSRTELREVEGGEGEMEMATVFPDGEAPVRTPSANPVELEEKLRIDAYKWPRLVAPPLKRSGHVVMDACTADGDIQRVTFARSHGKQTYYDARKSTWGDLFPHPPKGTPVVRDRGVRKLTPPTVEEDSISETDEDLEKLMRKFNAHNLAAKLVETDLDVELPSEVKSATATTRISEGGDVMVVTSNYRSKRGFHTSARHSSVAPQEPGAAAGAPARPKVTVAALQALRESDEPITVLTAYDYPTSLLCSRSGIDIILVGDSLAQVALGYPTTVPLSLDEMIHHTKAVKRGSGSSFLLVDLPLGYAEESLAAGMAACVRLIKEGGADGIKIEGGREILPLVRRLADFGIPIMPHIGLQPQRAISMGYRAQARNAIAGADLVALAKEFEEAGAFSLLLEAIPASVGKAATEAVNIPTIGIGAGPACSGQVLVLTDMMGTYDMGVEGDEAPKAPKFVREFAPVGRESRKAVDGFVAAVKARTFPVQGKETYGMPKEHLEEFKALVADMTKKE